MKPEDFTRAGETDHKQHVTRPYDNVPVTTLVKGSNSHLIKGHDATISFITMEAGSVFELHSHLEEQIMIVIEGYCDEIIEDKLYRVEAGDVIHLPSNIKHGAFLLDVDCKAIDVFVPARKDYEQKFHDQNPGEELPFV